MSRPRKLEPAQCPVVIVEWLDATFNSKGADNTPELAHTVGYLIKVTAEYIKVTHEIFKDGSARGTTAIPGGMVRKVSVLMRRGLPDGWAHPEGTQ